MYPEAGGSSSFARRAFNEFWSFFAAWGQMLNYTITIAISAFFVPHYIGGLFWEPLRHGAGRHHRRRDRDRVLCAASTSSAPRSPRGVNIALAVVDFMTQVLLVLSASSSCSRRRRSSTTSTSASRRRGRTSSLAIPIGDDRLHRASRRSRTWPRRPRTRRKTIPAAINRVRDRRLRDLLHAARRRAVARCRSRSTPTASTSTLLGPPGGPGRLRGRPDPRRRQVARPRASCSGPAEIYVGLLAATILFIATNAGIIGVSRLVYSMGIHRQMPDRLRRLHPKLRHAVDRDPHLRRIASHRSSSPGQAAFLGQHLRVRRDALVHDRARGGRSGCGSQVPDDERPYRGAGQRARSAAATSPLFAVVRRASARVAAFVVVTVLHPAVAIARRRLARRSASASTSLYRRHQGLDLTTTHEGRRPAAGRRARGRVRVGARRVRRRATSTARRSRPRRGSAARRRRGIHVLVTITVPELVADRRRSCPTRRWPRRAIIEQARVQGGRRVTGHWTKVRAGQAGRVIVDEAQRDARARDRDAAAAAHGDDARSARRSRPCSPSGPAASSSRPVPPTAPGSALRSPVVPDPREVAPHGDAVLSAIMVVIGVLLIVRTFAGGGGPISLGLILGVLFMLAGVCGCGSTRSAALSARHRDRARTAGRRRRALGAPIIFSIIYTSVASAIYFSLGVVADHALGLTPVVYLVAGAVLRPHGDDLRRGRVAAPGARRRDGLRPLRLQRAVELRRGLGDPARLPDPHRDHVARRRRTTSRRSGARPASGAVELVIAIAIIVYVAVRNIMGFAVDALEADRRARDRGPRAAAAHRRRGRSSRR